MSDFIPAPTIETVCRYSQYNFTLVIVAYRKLTNDEAHIVYGQYLSSKHLKFPPKGKTVRVETLHGYNLE